LLIGLTYTSGGNSAIHKTYQIMKKLILFQVFLWLFSQGFSQIYKPYPIPSYNIPVQNLTFFQETPSGPLKAKKDIHVQVTCAGKSDTTCCARVVIYSLDGESTFGPFRVCCGETLVQTVDEREWGVAVESTCQVTVSVWVTEGKLPEQMQKKKL